MPLFEQRKRKGPQVGRPIDVPVNIYERYKTIKYFSRKTVALMIEEAMENYLRLWEGKRREAEKNAKKQ